MNKFLINTMLVRQYCVVGCLTFFVNYMIKNSNVTLLDPVDYLASAHVVLISPLVPLLTAMQRKI